MLYYSVRRPPPLLLALCALIPRLMSLQTKMLPIRFDSPEGEQLWRRI